MRGLQLPLQKGADGIVDGVPKAQKQVGPFPNSWYVLEDFQALKFVVKLSNEKEKPLKGTDSR